MLARWFPRALRGFPTAFRWLSGAMIATLMIASTSPLFVRSYLPREPNRGVWTLPAGNPLRWRSEGYATTKIGPYGMPGKSAVPAPDHTARRVALWGDSQAEGVCVADHDKIFALAEQSSDQQMAVFPLAQSGDHVGDWISQMRWAEKELKVTDHVFLIVDLSDLRLGPASHERPPQWSQWASANLPAFVISAVRNLSTLPDGSPRRLRFRPGPIPVGGPSASDPASPRNDATEMAMVLRSLRGKTTGSITILYAPKIPHITDGQVRSDGRDDDTLESLKDLAAESRILLIDVSPAMIEAASRGDWPHGFQNGLIGNGHLNRIGNRIIAEAIVGGLR